MQKFLILFMIFSPLYALDSISISSLIQAQATLSQGSRQQELLVLFQQERYPLFIKEAEFFVKQSPANKSEELTWLIAHSYLQLKFYPQAQTILENLTNSKSADIRDRSLFDLAYIYNSDEKFKEALALLDSIQKKSTNEHYKELATVKSIQTAFAQKNPTSAQRSLELFSLRYPDSQYLGNMHYYFALYSLLNNEPKKAKEYAQRITQSQTNIQLQRLLAEIALQETQYDEALSRFLPLTKTNTQYLQEALFKSGLLYKHLNQVDKAHEQFSTLIAYHTSSPYYERALLEQANINIALKKYNEALSYFTQESGHTGDRKAYALLKIAEINFLTGKTSSVRRTAKRIQREFPYSAYANEALYWEGRAYLSDKNFQESISALQDYLVREPQNIKRDEIMLFLAFSYANLDNISQSRQYYQQIINNSKNDYFIRKALLGLGRSYHIQEPKRSLEYFDRVWKKWADSTESAEALYYSGAVNYNLRDNKTAKNYFSKVINSYKDSPFVEDAKLALAKLEFKSERFDKILALDSDDLSPNNKEKVSEFKELQARSFFRLHDYDKALTLFKESQELTKDPQRKTDLFFAEASTLRNLGRIDEAIRRYEQFLNSPNMQKSTLDELIWSEIIYSYLELDKLNKASKLVDDFQQSFPNSPLVAELYTQLGDLYFSKESYNKALSNYELADKNSSNTTQKADLALKKSWSLYETDIDKSRESLLQYIKNYPTHYGRADALYRLSLLCKDKQNQYTDEILNKFSTSIEAEKIRLAKVDQLKTTDSIDTFYQQLSGTKDKALRAKILFKLATKFEQEQKINEAIQLYKDIHSLKDQALGAKSLFRSGQLLMTQNKHQDALKDFVNIIAQYDEENYPQALDYIIQNYIILDQKNNAQKFKERLIEQFPDSPESKKWATTTI